MKRELTSRCDRWVLRRLQGQLDSAEQRELEQLLEQPELARRAAALEATWRDLEPPPASSLPLELRNELMTAVRLEQARQAWPMWARPGLAAALLLGVTIGMAASQPELPATATADVNEIFWLEPDVGHDSWWPDEGGEQL